MKYFSIKAFARGLFCHSRCSNRESSFLGKQRLLDTRFHGYDNPSHFTGTFARDFINSFFKCKASYRLLLTPCCLLLTSHFFISCAPKVITPVPPQYREELSLDEIVSKVSDDIQVLKAIADIRIEKNSELYDQINASVIFQRPDRAHMRMYKFGMLVSDIVKKDGELYVLTGKKDTKLAGLIEEFLYAVFWWDDVEGGFLYSQADEYIIRNVRKEIHLDKATLLPVIQDISSSGKTVHITYAEPQNYEGFWYPSKLAISVDDFRFSVKIDKLIKNPPLGESDFKTPSGG
ncbi:MAG: hypothetical protein HZB30_01090 [Nitrospirae bacterium]|nr:hypothetical protein [Nitrospirota bacterium]